ncbi:MAG: hypothetical protein KA059_05845 [Elusimicrobiales bacterium]|nr:hypothetical protein [Elusimicrobiales bacterium]
MKFRKSTSSKVNKILNIVKISCSGNQFSKEELVDDFGASLKTLFDELIDIRYNNRLYKKV